MPHILGAGVWQEALTFSRVISCFCVSFLVVLLAATCLIFAVRLGIVTWRHCKRLEAGETLDASGRVAWDLWHVVADIFKWKKNWSSSICWSFPPVLMALCSVISSLSIPNEDGLSANLSCPYVPSDWLVTSPHPESASTFIRFESESVQEKVLQLNSPVHIRGLHRELLIFLPSGLVFHEVQLWVVLGKQTTVIPLAIQCCEQIYGQQLHPFLLLLIMMGADITAQEIHLGSVSSKGGGGVTECFWHNCKSLTYFSLLQV